MFPGFSQCQSFPVCGMESSEEMQNLQKHYQMECGKDMSQFRTEYMKNMFGLVPRQIDYPNAGQIAIMRTQNIQSGPPDGERNRPVSGQSEHSGQCDRPFVLYGKPTEKDVNFASLASDNVQKNLDKNLSEDSEGSSGRTERGETSGLLMNVSTDSRCDICDNVIQDFDMTTGNRLTRCRECEKYFPDLPHFSTPVKVRLKNRFHVKLLHTCEVCDKKFASSSSLKTHGRVHSGEKPYECSFCDKTFVYEGNMKTHMRTHTGEKPFKCDECGKSFSQSGTLKKHLRVHSGEKPFKCEFCDKTFAYSENLIPHRRVHSGLKPFHCHLCEKSFSQPGSLKGHIKTAHETQKKNIPQSTGDELKSDINEKTSVEQLNI